MQALGEGISLEDLEDFTGALQRVGGTIAKAAPQSMPVLKAAAKGGLAGAAGGVGEEERDTYMHQVDSCRSVLIRPTRRYP